MIDARRERLVPERRDAELDLLPLADFEGLPLRHLEAEAQPRRVYEGGEGIARLHPAARFHGPRVDHAAPRGPDLGSPPVLKGDVAVRSVGSGLGRELLGLLARPDQLLGGDEMLLGQLLTTLQIVLGSVRVGQGLLVHRLGAIRLELVAVGVDPDENGLGGDAIPLMEEHLADRALHLPRDLHQLLGLEGAEGLDLEGDVPNLGGSDPDPNSRRPLRSGARIAGRPGAGRQSEEEGWEGDVGEGSLVHAGPW